MLHLSLASLHRFVVHFSPLHSEVFVLWMLEDKPSYSGGLSSSGKWRGFAMSVGISAEGSTKLSSPNTLATFIDAGLHKGVRGHGSLARRCRRRRGRRISSTTLVVHCRIVTGRWNHAGRHTGIMLMLIMVLLLLLLLLLMKKICRTHSSRNVYHSRHCACDKNWWALCDNGWRNTALDAV